ncbi:MAG: PilZ domain-containing protein [Candidatus Omnitrophica bacterium]|nr:PilZ domain-containing protein [Candidatus Omnitrophota bacterium]
MQEKRKHPRLSTRQDTHFFNSAIKEKIELLDISLGGMRILSSRQLALGMSVEGQFSIIPNSRPFYIKGIVTWLKPSGLRNACYEIGIKFTDISTIPLE